MSSDASGSHDSGTIDDGDTTGGATSDGITPADPLQEDIDGVVVDGLEGGVIALISRDGVVTHAATGDANADGDPLLADSLFSIASITKTYTATIIYQLEEQGRLDTSAPLSTYLPDTSYGPGVTLDTLLSHRSGIPDYVANPAYLQSALSDPDRLFTTEELIEYATFEAPSAPGESFQYSNTGYLLLGLVVEQVTGETLPEALQTGVIAPLGLTSTRFVDPPDFPDDLPSAWLDPTSLGLPPDTELPVMPVSAAFSGCQADCGIVTTAPELKIFFEALFDGTLVSATSLAKMTASEPDAPRWGRGLEIFELAEGASPAYGHGGGGAGYTSLAVFEPGSGDITIFFASNDAFDLDPLYAAYGL